MMPGLEPPDTEDRVNNFGAYGFVFDSPFTPLGTKAVGEGNAMSTPVCLTTPCRLSQQAPRCSPDTARSHVHRLRSATALLQQRFQLGQRVQILRSPRGALGADEPWKVQTPASAAENIHVHGVGNERNVVTAAV